jgi:trehalose 6-phosphate synthase
VHIVDNYPSREDLPEYREYTALVSRLAREIDDEFGTDTWTPLLLDISDDYPGSLAALRISDVVFVNSVRDGMNLVVLEGIVLSEQDPAVVLSRHTGAADLLGDDALLVNPFDVSEMANALHEALSMPDEDRLARCKRLRAAAVALPPGPWFRAQLDAVTAR